MLTQEQKNFLNEYIQGNWKVNKKDNSIDVDGDVDFSHKDRHVILCSFNKVTGNFICSNNNLLWTQGAPLITEGDLDFSYNRSLIELELSNSIVGRDFKCSSTNIKTLRGLPKKVGGTIRIENCPLVSVDGIQNTSYKALQIDFVHNDMISPEALNILLERTLEYKKYCYILPLTLSLLDINDPIDIQKITENILPHYYDSSQENEICDIILNEIKGRSNGIGNFTKILFEKLNPIYSLLNTKKGEILDDYNSLLDLGFNF